MKKIGIVICLLLSWVEGYSQNPPEEQLFLDFPLISYPYIEEAERTTGGFIESYMNPDMDMSLKLTEDFYTYSHFLLRKWIEDRYWRSCAIILFDGLSSYIPLGYAWEHEEFHRAVMTHRGVNSFNEVLLMPIGSSTISVSHETDEDLAAMCNGYRPDFIRLMSAGLEGQTRLVQEIQRKDFFYHRNLENEFLCFANIINNVSYSFICAAGLEGDIEKMNRREVSVRERDFTGYDLNAWAYELFNPDKKYEDRGPHPSGIGINRYIVRENLSSKAIGYLWRQTCLEALNLLNPMLYGHRRYYLGSTKSGEYYGNACIRHYLTSFGDDLILEGLFETPFANSYVSLHDYNNYKHHFAGIEAGIVDKRLLKDRIGLSISAQAWKQPEGFYSADGHIGGMAECKLSFKTNLGEPYIDCGIKSDGWVAGNVNLERSSFARFGFRLNLN